jgi:wyosine [tRNA(Phe)-imidazoG37] synthetase (radical SAM superfamily)
LLFNSLNPRIPSNVENLNLSALAEAYDKIKPHIVQIYTLAREPAEKGIYALSQKEKANIRHFLDENVKDKNIVINIY